MAVPNTISPTGGEALETLIARLTRAAYDVALRHTPDRPFTELQFTLWQELRSVIQTAPVSVGNSV